MLLPVCPYIHLYPLASSFITDHFTSIHIRPPSLQLLPATATSTWLSLHSLPSTRTYIHTHQLASLSITSHQSLHSTPPASINLHSSLSAFTCFRPSNHPHPLASSFVTGHYTQSTPVHWPLIHHRPPLPPFTSVRLSLQATPSICPVTPSATTFTSLRAK